MDIYACEAKYASLEHVEFEFSDEFDSVLFELKTLILNLQFILSVVVFRI